MGLNSSPVLAKGCKSGCPASTPRPFPQRSGGGADKVPQRPAADREQQGRTWGHTARAKLRSLVLVLGRCGGAGVGAQREPWVLVTLHHWKAGTQGAGLGTERRNADRGESALRLCVSFYPILEGFNLLHVSM